jgi:hypothetical protein
MAHVLYLKKEKAIESKAVLQRMKAWEVLKTKRKDVMELKVMLHILNSIWKAHNREQSFAVAWLVAEVLRFPGVPSDKTLFVQKVTSKTLVFLRTLGYKVDSNSDHGCDYIWYQSKRSLFGSPVYQFSVSAELFGSEDIDALKAKMFEYWSKLPPEEKRKPRKKKKGVVKK